MEMNTGTNDIGNEISLHVPVEARPLESGAVQKIYRFENGYGASVVKGEHTYGGDEGLWELAVLGFFYDQDNYTYELVYDTEITQDVEGHLSDEGVEDLLYKIKRLPMRGDKQLQQQGNERLHQNESKA
jgi:hypothetical protein